VEPVASFAVDADAYDRFMGRYSVRLAPSFADFAGIAPGQRVLDVGCGPGALTTELVHRLGASDVAAVDPTEQFVAAARERHPGVEVRIAAAEELPFADGQFDATLAQLVVHFMDDPVRGLAEMARGIEESALPVSVEHATFEDWWEPFTLGVGPAGVYLTSLDNERRSELRERCYESLGAGPFAIESRAWTARGYV
jgi:ubiquinone/menaquinone biosynthesis C-methylase UbiE